MERAARKVARRDLSPLISFRGLFLAREWSRLSTGITQRVQALNAFLHDIYHRQEIIRSGRLPADLVTHNEAFLPKMLGVTPPGNVYTHVVGIDLIRTGPDEFFVLEDNARTPSGVSYMLENRATMLHMFPELFSQNRVQSVENYPRQLYRSLAACAPADIQQSTNCCGTHTGDLQLCLLRAQFSCRQDGG